VWHIPIIPIFRRLTQELEASLGCMILSYLKKTKTNKKQSLWGMQTWFKW
jgi:hypothetical protein